MFICRPDEYKKTNYQKCYRHNNLKKYYNYLSYPDYNSILNNMKARSITITTDYDNFRLIID